MHPLLSVFLWLILCLSHLHLKFYYQTISIIYNARFTPKIIMMAKFIHEVMFCSRIGYTHRFRDSLMNFLYDYEFILIYRNCKDEINVIVLFYYPMKKKSCRFFLDVVAMLSLISTCCVFLVLKKKWSKLNNFYVKYIALHGFVLACIGIATTLTMLSLYFIYLFIYCVFKVYYIKPTIQYWFIDCYKASKLVWNLKLFFKCMNSWWFSNIFEFQRIK